MKTMQRFVLFFLLSVFSFYAQGSVCDYTVSDGEWIAQILRGMGSSDPFKDKSYFKTVKLNKDVKNLHKLQAGDVIKIPKEIMSAHSRKKWCGESAARVPASTRSELKEPSYDDQFPVLEYDAATTESGPR